MTFITQNANIALLFLIVLASAGLVAATLYFQANFSKMNEAYDLRVEELSHVTSELESQKKALTEVSSEAQLKAKREEEIAGKFGEVKTAKETLEQQKLSLDKQLSAAEARVNELKLDNSKLGSDLLQYKGEYEKCQSYVTKCNSDLREAIHYRDLYLGQWNDCKSKLK